MSYVDFVGPGIKLANEAAQLDEAKEYDAALDKYFKSVETLITAVKHEKQEKKKKMLREKVNELMDRAAQIKKFLKEIEDDSIDANPSTSGEGTKAKSKSKKETKKSKEEKNLSDSLDGAILQTKPNVQWKDVAGLEEAKSALKEAVIMPLKFPQLFIGKRTPWSGILLYGPPGTGKSYLAQAVATEANSTFFNISASSIVSKWQGESEKLVSLLFKKARECKPSIIFIDEIDSLASVRTDSENDATRRIKTELLIQMQGVGKDSKGILVLGATNIPWNLDPAFIRRFERRIKIGLPDCQARMKMFEIHIGSTPNTLNKKNIYQLGKMTEKYSGSDISTVVRAALMEPVKTCQIATHFKKVSGPDPMNPESGVILNDLLTPCSPGDPQAIEMSLNDVPPEKLLPPLIHFNDFIKALKNSKPSVAEEGLKQYENFTKKYGFDG